MQIFTIFIVLSYLLFTNPFIGFTMSEDSIFLVFKSVGSSITDGEYYEFTKVRTYKLFKFK